MKPEQVNHKKFPSPLIIYNNSKFSMAWGSYECGANLGMRWNGAGNDEGYPNRGRYPVWFMLPEDLSISIVKGLLGARSADQP